MDFAPATIRTARKLLKQIGHNRVQIVDPAKLTLKSRIPFKIRIFRELANERVFELGGTSIRIFERGDFVSAAITTRAVVETSAMCWYASQRFRELDVSSEDQINETLNRLLLGSKDAAAKNQAVNVLTMIGEVEKQVPHFSLNYQSLCEVTHPNWAGVLGAYGTRETQTHIMRIAPKRKAEMESLIVRGLCGALVAFALSYNDLGTLVDRWNLKFEGRSVDV
jgi:hypothetical protein